MPDDHPFGSLAGTWRGTGSGEYPTIDRFEYTEELIVAPVPGRPIAHWRSATRDAASGEPRHAESGFVRMTPAGVELVVAHGFGIVEAAAGRLADGVLDVSTTGLLGTASAKSVTEVHRHYRFATGTLRYEISMAAVGIPLTHHLRAVLVHDSSG